MDSLRFLINPLKSALIEIAFRRCAQTAVTITVVLIAIFKIVENGKNFMTEIY